MMGFLKYVQLEDYETAGRYLQPEPRQNTNLAQRAKELQALSKHFNSSIALLSDDPNGTVEPGLPPGQLRAGVLTVGSTTADVILARVDDQTAGKIWLVSKDTVASIPGLYVQMESEAPTAFERIMPAGLTGRRLLGMSLAKWLGWLLSIPISWLLASLFALLLGAPQRIRYKLRRLPFRPIWTTRIGVPLKCMIAILMQMLFVYLLQPPLLYRVYYFRFMVTLLMGCFVWLVSTITDQGFEHVVNRTRTQRKGGESILILMQRLTHILFNNRLGCRIGDIWA
jgi:MscS family membrane protein